MYPRTQILTPWIFSKLTKPPHAPVNARNHPGPGARHLTVRLVELTEQREFECEDLYETHTQLVVFVNKQDRTKTLTRLRIP